MATIVTWKVKGLEELQRKMQQMPQDVAKRLIRNTLREAGEIVSKKMSELAPRKTGLLAKDFNVTVGIGKGGELSGEARIGPRSGVYYPYKGNIKEIKIATGKHGKKGGAIPVISVARFQEFGTSKMQAHPFMRPAFEQVKDQVLAKIIGDIQTAIAVRVF